MSEDLSKQKEDAFGRLIVHPFASMLDKEFPRAKLNSFFEAIKTMIGEDAVHTAQNECGNAFMRLREERGRKFSWEDLYMDKEAIQVLDKVKYLMACTFVKDFHKRIEWFVEMLNRDIRSISIDSESFITLEYHKVDFHATIPVVEKLIYLLFLDMQERNLSEVRRNFLIKTYGIQAIKNLNAVCSGMSVAIYHPN